MAEVSGKLSVGDLICAGEQKPAAFSPWDWAFERRLAMVQLEEALARCERSLVDSGLAKHWAAFDAFAVKPEIHAVARPPLAKVAEELGFASAVHVASALKVVRKRIRLLLREVVAETAIDPDDQEAEYRQIVSLLS